MFKNEKNFVESLLEECNNETRQSFIKYFNLPVLLERTLTEYYIEDLVIKQIAGRHNVDDRTVKRWKKQAIDMATEHFKQSLRCHFNTTVKE